MAEISAKLKEGDPVTVTYDIPEDLDGLTEAYGAEVVYRQASANIVVGLQSYIRSQMAQDKKPKEIQTAVNDWKPGSRAPAKSKVEKAVDLYDTMSEDDKAALLAKLQGE